MTYQLIETIDDSDWDFIRGRLKTGQYGNRTYQKQCGILGYRAVICYLG
jgi:hypothetical protein